MTLLAGILNLSPDSFSGDGTSAAAEALARVDAMIDDGVAIIDVGGESTRPGATALSPETEWQRLSPFIRSLGARVEQARFSIDTRHASTAHKALDAGFHIINDVSAGSDSAMIELVRTKDATLILMHSLSVPADPKHTLPGDCDPVEAVCDWAVTRLQTLERAGISRERIIIDPGIGFGKTAQQSLVLIKGIARFKTLGTQVMVGHSRKSFLSLFTPKDSGDRDMETLIVSQWLALRHVDFLRVHNTRMHAIMLRIMSAL